MPAPVTRKYNHAFATKKKGEKGYGTPKTAALRIIAKQNSLRISPTHTKVIKRYMNKSVRKDGGSLDIRLTHNFATSKKPLQSRMGKGKGRPESTGGAIFKGMPIINLHGRVIKDNLLPAFSKVAYRLGLRFKCKSLNINPRKNVVQLVRKRRVQEVVKNI